MENGAAAFSSATYFPVLLPANEPKPISLAVLASRYSAPMPLVSQANEKNKEIKT